MVLINIRRIDEDGKTAYERRRGRAWKKALPVFGECIWWMRPESAGEQKLETRWENGVYLGVRTESTEIIVGNEKGVVKTRTYAARPDGQRWNKEEFETFQGVLWEPITGRGRIELKSSVVVQENYGSENRKSELNKSEGSKSPNKIWIGTKLPWSAQGAWHLTEE